MRRSPGAASAHDDVAEDERLCARLVSAEKRGGVSPRSRALLWSVVAGLLISCHGSSTPAFTSTTGVPGSTGAQSTTSSTGISPSSSSSTSEADSAPASSSSPASSDATVTAPVTDVGWESSSSGDTVPEGCQGKFACVAQVGTLGINNLAENLVASLQPGRTL